MIGHKLAFLVTVIFLKLISGYKLKCEIRSYQNYRDLYKALSTTFKNNAKVCGFQDGNATVGLEQKGNLNECSSVKTIVYTTTSIPIRSAELYKKLPGSRWKKSTFSSQNSGTFEPVIRCG
jgi:hypothetical protein